VEEMDHVCDYCKKLVKRQKQDRLEKWESVKDKIFDCDSSGDEEEDAEESLVPMETKLIPSLLGNVYLNPYLLGNVVLAIGVMARIGNRGRATIAGIDLGSTNSAEKDRIDGNPQRWRRGGSLSMPMNIGVQIAWCLSKLLQPLCFSWGGGRGRKLPTRPRPTLPKRRSFCGNACTVDGRQ